jgi:5-methylcytosine-specific restriction endonuclease McrA
MRNPAYYRLFRKRKCERCGYKVGGVFALHVHHRNHKHWDDRKENLETLCEPCHVEHHRKKQKKLKKLPSIDWMTDYYSVSGGKQVSLEPKKGILDYFM